MQPYLTPVIVRSGGREAVTRKADKTGLIAWQGNKYSVPMAYQRCGVGVREAGGRLRLIDLESGEEIAHHPVCLEKGRVIRNTDHYRDRAQQISDYEDAIVDKLGGDYGSRLCALLKATSPRIYKDQLAGARRILGRHETLHDALMDRVLQRTRLTATGLRDYLEAYASQLERLQIPSPHETPGTATNTALYRYADLAVTGAPS